MAIDAHHVDGAPARRWDRERFEYAAIYAIAFTAFFAVALLSRLLPRRMRTRFAREHGSVLAEARAATAMSIPYAFMR